MNLNVYETVIEAIDRLSKNYGGNLCLHFEEDQQTGECRVYIATKEIPENPVRSIDHQSMQGAGATMYEALDDLATVIDGSEWLS
jgi:hypothetical protein